MNVIERNISIIEAQIASLQNTVTVLKKELLDSGASGSSARKGKQNAVKEKVSKKIAQRRARQMKKATGGR